MKERLSIGSELDLWVTFKDGNEDAFIIIYNTHVQLLFRYGTNITPDENLVKDCIQSLFLDLWNRRNSLGDTDSIKFYLMKSLKRRIHKELIIKNKHLSVDTIVEDHSFGIILPHETKIAVSEFEHAKKQRLERGMKELTKRQREAIYLYFYAELSYEEVASIMSLKVPSVYDLVYDALKILKNVIRKNDIVYTALVAYCINVLPL